MARKETSASVDWKRRAAGDAQMAARTGDPLAFGRFIEAVWQEHGLRLGLDRDVVEAWDDAYRSAREKTAS